MGPQMPREGVVIYLRAHSEMVQRPCHQIIWNLELGGSLVIDEEFRAPLRDCGLRVCAYGRCTKFRAERT